MIKNDCKRGECVIGVDFHNNKFRARCHTLDGSKFIGHYDTETLAFNAYKEYKEKYIKQVAEDYKKFIPDRVYSALLKYTVEKED